MVRPGDDCRVSGDVGGSLGDWGGVGPRGLPGARGRVAGPGDAAALLRLKQRLDRETSFMLLEVGERDTSVRVLARQLEDMARSGNSVVIVAEIGADLAGYVELAGGEFRRNRATAQLVIGVLAEASGKGVGSGLLEEAKRWAAAHGLHRLGTHRHDAQSPGGRSVPAGGLLRREPAGRVPSGRRPVRR